jgi:hypothetical protein
MPRFHRMGTLLVVPAGVETVLGPAQCIPFSR